jgi:hypothetical protein
MRGARFHTAARRRHRQLEASCVDLRAGWAEQDLGGGGQRLVVEIPKHDQGALPALAVTQPGGVVAQRDGLGRSQCERVAGVARALALVARVEAIFWGS